MTWRLRRAGIADLEGIMDIERATFPADAWSAQTMAHELADPNGFYIVAESADGELDGYAGLLAPAGAEDADVQTVAVVERARRRGIGRMLVTALLAEADDRGALRVFLEVRADNPSAQQLYRTLGFAEVGVRRGYYQPEGVDAIVMRRSASRGEPAEDPA
ncbi:ribosomal protein S18-alanine N-acetyltransferase [Naasia aerilata]|uniref:Ribosomal-protein-alanine acetyltransferase n=1 Tax=Naasia aerilata TaxID=1162966 RepID=A0ABM8G9W2_9MICO|nr:ribosomal protein S18-alanine N-acetyltransferase [Naasia aerilata]BDZ44988.1 ribosomal-protein-alanine acetyltransferase [Naasia aerilata]